MTRRCRRRAARSVVDRREVPLAPLATERQAVSPRPVCYVIPPYVPSSVSRAVPAALVPVRLVTRARTGAVLVTGATCRVGRLVVDELLRADVPVRALTRRPQQAVLPAGAEVVVGDLTAPASLDAALEGVGAVFLVWTAA